MSSHLFIVQVNQPSIEKVYYLGYSKHPRKRAREVCSTSPIGGELMWISDPVVDPVKLHRELCGALKKYRLYNNYYKAIEFLRLIAYAEEVTCNE